MSHYTRRRQANGGGPTLELASCSAEANSTPSRRRRAKVGRPRLQLASGSAEGNSAPSGIRQAEVRGPFGALKLWLWMCGSDIWLKRLSELKLGDRLAVYIR
jgi:hypothetical protein